MRRSAVVVSLTAALALVGCDDPDTEVNATAIATLQATVDALSADLTDARTRLEAAEATVAELDAGSITQAELDALEATLRGDLDTTALATTVAELETAVAANTTATADNGVAIAANTTAIADLTAELGTLGTTVAANTAGIADNTTAIDANATAIAANTTAIDANTAAIDANTTAIDANTTDIASGEIAVAALQTTVDGLETDVDDLGTDLTSLDEDLTDLGDRTFEGVITSNTTWTIGGSSADYADVEDAWEDALAHRIAADVTLTLQINNGTYTMSGQWEFSHPDSDRIAVVGNVSSPRSVVLDFPSGSGLVVVRGNTLRSLSGVMLQGDGTNGAAVYASGNSYAYLDDVVLSEFQRGLYVEYGAMVYVADDGLVVEDMANDGVRLNWGAVVRANGVEVDDVGSDGIEVVWGSVGYFNEADVADAASVGVRADWQSVGYFNNATIANAPYGTYASWNSIAYSNDINISNARTYAVYAGYGSINYARYADIRTAGWGFVMDTHAYVDGRSRRAFSGVTNAWNRGTSEESDGSWMRR